MKAGTNDVLDLDRISLGWVSSAFGFRRHGWEFSSGMLANIFLFLMKDHDAAPHRVLKVGSRRHRR